MSYAKDPQSRRGIPPPSAEHRLITSLSPYLNYRPSARYPVGPGDDAAVRSCASGERLVLTTDCMVEGTHFTFGLLRPEEVGWKAMAANVSDCAAMGAQAESALVDLVFSGRRPQATIRRLYAGFRRACRRWDFSIVGGNLAAGPCWVVSITMVGRLASGTRPALRSRARPGDTVWVTGWPGESAAGLAALRKWGRRRAMELFPRLVRRHTSPAPEITSGPALGRDPRVHAMVDISDGVAKEARTVAYESGVGIVLDPSSFPVGPEMQRAARKLGTDPVTWVLGGGEDYGLLFTAADSFDPCRLPGGHTTRFTAIGRVVRGHGVSFAGVGRRSAARRVRGWDHLR